MPFVALAFVRVGAQVEFKIQVQEWKNILVRGNDPAQLEKYSLAFVKGGETTRAELQKLDKLLDRLQLRTPLVDEAIATQNQLVAHYLEALKKYDAANPDSATSSTRWSRAWTASRPRKSTTSSPSSARSRSA